jgi:hypothetical protein
MMMMKSVLPVVVVIAANVASISASTNVAVLEFGNRGTVRATNNAEPERTTTVEGVASFWSALTDRSSRRKQQHSGMSVIPDMFRLPDSTLVIGISDVDIDSLEAFFADDMVGVLEVPGKNVKTLLAKVPNFEHATVESFNEKCESFEMGKDLKALNLSFGGQPSDDDVHAALAPGLRKLKEMAISTGRTLVVHLVVENNKPSLPTTARRLQEQENANNQQADGYYGYGYYKNGVWVTPYKSMFQIQYFNVVTWTAIGLAFAIFYTFYLMLFMPLEPDTLLFGESAKLVGEN